MKLIFPNEQYYNSYMDAIAEYRVHGLDTANFLGGDELFARVKDLKDGVNLPNGYVPATYLWLVDGDEFIGEISIRHALTHALLRFGGNIGYVVRYSRWNTGAGTKMLAMALEYAKNTVGLNRALVTCNDENIASARVIEKNGGVLQDKIENTIGGKRITTRRYWIEL